MPSEIWALKNMSLLFINVEAHCKVFEIISDDFKLLLPFSFHDIVQNLR